MPQRPSRAMGVLSDQCPLTRSSARASEWELSLPRVHHQADSHARSVPDPGPVGFDFALPDDDPGDLLVMSGFTWRGVLRKDGG